MAFSALSHLDCSATGKRYDADAVQGVSEAGKPLLARYDLEQVKATVTPAEIDRRIAKRGLTHLQYYNGATHQAVFALPNFVRDLTTGARLGPRLVSKRRVAGGGK